MSFSSYDSTSNGGLRATSQAPRELGDSKKFLQIRGASPVFLNLLQLRKSDRHNQRWKNSPTTLVSDMGVTYA